MDSDVIKYLSNMNDEQLGLFWIIASEGARKWISGELVRRAKDRGEILVEPKETRQRTVAA